MRLGGWYAGKKTIRVCKKRADSVGIRYAAAHGNCAAACFVLEESRSLKKLVIIHGLETAHSIEKSLDIFARL